MSESNLVLQAQQGDAAAWETLVQHHQKAVFRLAYLLLGNGDDAGDVAQEVFVRTFRSLHRFDVERPLRPWLLRITANLASNHRRTIGRYLVAWQRLIRLTPEQAVAEAPDKILPSDDSQAVWQATRRLGRVDQEVIYLRYFLELSTDETAAAMGVAPGTVKSRLNRALQRLRHLIEREFPDLWKERLS